MTMNDLAPPSALMPAMSSNRPIRVQLRRTAGWRMPANTVKVDRTTKWGNPFVPGKLIPFGPMKGQLCADKRHAFVLFRSFAPQNPALVAAAQSELFGANLACWCDQPNPYEDECHATVLLEIANPVPAEGKP